MSLPPSTPPPPGRPSSWPHPGPNAPAILREVPNAELTKWDPLVFAAARRYARRLPPNIVVDDLVSAGRIAVWETLRRYPNVNARYLALRIGGAVVDELRCQDWLPRRLRETTKASSSSVSHHGLDDLSPTVREALFAHDPRDRLDARVGLRQIAEGLTQLEPRDRRILLAILFEGHTQQDVALELGVSDPRISQLYERALTRLRELLVDKGSGEAREEPL